METTTAQRSVSQGSHHEPEYQIVASRHFREDWLARATPYSTAMRFIRGQIDVAGDLVAAVRDQLALSAPGWYEGAATFICRFAPWRIADLYQTKSRAAQNIRFHYDRSNDFYRQFLDSRMVYSCAYFRHPQDTLDDAQASKLDLICRKLRLAPGERFLDIGCGWGALVMDAVSQGADATGCTLSRRQADYARSVTGSRATIHERDYRDLSGRFHKIASVGMFEHVGSLRLEKYFRKIYDLLEPNGLFLNHGITRPSPVARDSSSLFIARRVFPGGSIVTLPEALEAAERAGFEVLDVENLRRHYALTCRAWVARLRSAHDACLRFVDERTWRTWQLFLAGSAVAFEDGGLGLHQVLLAKRGASKAAPMTREDMYSNAGKDPAAG